NAYHNAGLADRFHDDESIYSTNTSGLPPRDSWQSAATETVQQKTYPPLYPNEALPTDDSSSLLSSESPVPTVVVSSPTASDVSNIPRAGRTLITRPFTNNFSRPVRPSIDATSESEERKQRVLERNATRRRNSPSRERTRLAHINEPGPSIVERSSSPSIVLDHGSALPGKPSQKSLMQPSSTANLQPVTGLADPQNGHPSRSISPVSLYSNYSYYQLPSSSAASPTPFDRAIPDAPLDPSAFTIQPRPAPKPPTARLVSSSPLPTPVRSSPQASHTVTFALDPPKQSTAQKAQDYLQLGITHHEANRLKESAACFEKSAKEDGGCGVGMLMWGLTLRHGWGCEKNEKVAFKWLQRAAESAVDDLENARIGGGVDSTAIQSELVLAIYEVGQCFFQGWGVAKDQKMAVSYYTVAARLGDPDAQSDLAFCLVNGKGCKKDRKEAAKWYRAAVAQGASDVGLAWIYKEKFQ
ncbi:hypothetical protein C0992_003796, partial [Termitomyces sp. T32_za158]